MNDFVLQGVLKYLVGLVIVVLLTFLPAGTVHFWNGWLFLGVVFVPMAVFGIILFFKAPKQLKNRLDTRETLFSQKMVVVCSAMMFIAGFISSGFSFRFRYGRVADWLSVFAAVCYLIAYLFYVKIMRENPYLTRTVTICENQQIIDCGCYSIVRHPMYAVSIVMFLSMAVMLGSWICLLIFLCYPILIVNRVIEEENFLRANLEGYSDYQKRVKYRLIPFVW